jgi:hypothetical protein
MSYGSGAYGSTAYGGSANSANEQVIFPLLGNYAPDVVHERTVLFNGSQEYYEILVRQGSENPSGPNGAVYEIYTSHGEGETPQLRDTMGGAGQSIIAAAPIIVVKALVDGSIWVSGLNFSIVGRPYTQ